MRTKPLVVFVFLAVGLVAASSYSWGQRNARRPAIVAGANEVVDLQRTDAGWEGTWFWYVGDSYNATNLTGVTALGLLEAFNDTKRKPYLMSAIDAADFIMAHLGAGATGTQYAVRTTAPDIIFLHKLSEITGDANYAARALLEWENITIFWPDAASLDTLFRSLNRPSTWDIAFYMEAAFLSGDSDWAAGAAAILADTSDPFYYNSASGWYALNLAASLRALVGCRYYAQYPDAVMALLGSLLPLVDRANGVGGYAQDTAYAILALNSVGGAARAYANSLGRWLARNANASGGWTETDGNEYPEVDGEAVRALASTIGSNIALDGFEPGRAKSSSWRRAHASLKVMPF